MKVFVTGATGFIGHAVAARLSAAGHEVWGLTRSQEKAACLAGGEIHPVVGAMDQPETFVKAAAACQVVIHCAAEMSARSLELDRNTVELLLGALGDSNRSTMFLYTSGVWVYGNLKDECVDETSTVQPLDLVKLRVLTEQLVLAANERKLRTFVIRPGCVYGGKGSLTSAWFESAVKHGAAQIVGDGRNRWAMIHRQDLAELYLRVMESSCGGEIFNATDRSRFTVGECAEAASRAAGSGGKVKMISAPEARASVGPLVEGLTVNQHIDSSKAVRYLGWQPRHAGFVDGVERYFAAWRAYHAEGE